MARVRRPLGHLWRRLIQRGLSGAFASRVTRLEAAVVDLTEAREEDAAEAVRLRRSVGALATAAAGLDGVEHDLLVSVPTAHGPRRWLTLGSGRDHYVTHELGRVGLAGYEPGTLATLLALLEEPESAFADIGANIGLLSLVVAACRPDVPVAAFEPTPTLAAVCRQLTVRNGLSVDVHQVALGDQDATMPLHLSATDTSNSLRAGFRKSVGEVAVEVKRLDTWFSQRSGPVPTVWKVDTETTEPAVLRGANRTIEEVRPWLVVEVLHGRTEDQLAAWCDEHDYHPYHVLPDGPAARDRVVGDDSYEHLNWLFAPHPLPEGFHATFERWQDRLARSTTVDLRP